VSNQWQQCDQSIYHCEEPDPPNHTGEDFLVHIEQENDKSGKEEEKREMQKRRQSFNRPRNMHLVNAVGKECMHSRPLLWNAPRRLSQADVSTRPLMQ
jgi:hypothetical protein